MTVRRDENINVTLVDENDSVVGYKEKYEAHHNPVPLHRAISVIIYSPDKKKMLLQKRSTKKPTWRGFWSNATCTHPLPDESYKDAAKRRLFEEMGVKTSLKEVLRFTYEAEYDATWGEHELDAVFIGKYKGKVKIDRNEAEDYKWMDVDKLKIDVKARGDLYTPWFKLILSKLD